MPIMMAVSGTTPAVAAAPGGGYTAQGVNFDGTDSMTVAALTGIADGPFGIFSFWFRVNGGDGSYQIIFESRDEVSVELYRTNTNKLSIVLANATPSTVFGWTSTASFTAGGGWHHFLASWDVNAGVGAVYIDDAVEAAASVTGGETINYASASPNYDFGARVGPSLPISMDLADFYFNTAAYLDLSVAANRRLFITAGLAPVDLGSAGATPTGSTPMVFLHGTVASWHVNDGSGGGFTLTGTLTASSSNPP